MTEFRVDRLGHKGDGLIDGPDGVLAIAKVLPGEVISVIRGELQTIVTPSLERIDAFCQHYANCGGCKFQHWRDEPYRQWKHALVTRALAAQGLEVEVAPMIDAHGEGRRRVTLHVRQQDGVWVAGFMEQKSHDLCAIQQCPVLLPHMQHAPKIAASFGPVLGDCDVAITWAANGLDVAVKAERGIVSKRLSALSTLLRYHNLLRLSVNGDVHTVREQPFITLGKARVALPITAFLQATKQGEAVLIELVMRALPKAKRVADFFSGLGTFTFAIAEKVQVHAVDSDKPAIHALQNAARNTQGLKPIIAETRNLFNAPLIVNELKEFDCVVLDPPRSGAEAQCKMLAKSVVKQVIYVSCEPQSFARDAAILAGGGYKIVNVTPVDQFKWTAHVELVGVFKR